VGARGNVYRMQTLVFIKLFKGFLPTKTKCFFPIIKLRLKLRSVLHLQLCNGWIVVLKLEVSCIVQCEIL